MIGVTIASLVWVVMLLRDALPELRGSLRQLETHWLILPLLGCTLSGYIGFETFRALLFRSERGVYGRLVLGHLFFVAQLMKHLPGRIWGVAYQATAGNDLSLSVWASVTAAQMLIATGTAAWMALTVVGFHYSPVWGWVALVAGFGSYAFGWSRPLLGFVRQLLGKIPGRVSDKIQGALEPFIDAHFQFKLRILALFGAYWLVYLLSWAGYGLAWPGLGPWNGLALCAFYTLAWLAGYFSLVTPSGIGIRELVFVVLAQDFPADVVAGLAILGRFNLLLADIILGAAFAPFIPRNRSRSSARPARST